VNTKKINKKVWQAKLCTIGLRFTQLSLSQAEFFLGKLILKDKDLLSLIPAYYGRYYKKVKFLNLG
jgi:hypothetical protein